MDWSAALDASQVTGPATEAASALGLFRSAIAAVGNALKAYDGTAATADLNAHAAAADKAATALGKVADAAGKANDSKAKPSDEKAKKPKTPDLFSQQASDGKMLQASSAKELAARIKDREKLITEEKKKAAEREKAIKAAEKSNKASATASAAKKGAAVANQGAASLMSAAKIAGPLIALATGAAGFAGLAKIAIGARGMSQLLGIQARAEIGFRALFKGVDASPLIRAADLFSRNFTSATATGRAMGEIGTRAFNGIFKAVEAAEPYITAFAEGMVLGLAYVRVGFLRAELALLPYTGALKGLVSKSTALKTAALLGGAAIAGLAAYAVIAAAPLLPFAAAIASVAIAFEQAITLSKAWNDQAGSDMWEKFKQDIGINSADKAMANKGVLTGDAYDKAQAEKAKAAGNASGKALGDGVVAGMAAVEGSCAAGGAALAAAAERGVKTKAEIHSPSRMMRRSGRHMGEGVALGEEDSADRVNKAAASSLVPDMAKLGGIGGGGRGGASIVGPLVMVDKVIVQSENMASEFRMMLDSEAARIAETLNLVRA